LRLTDTAGRKKVRRNDAIKIGIGISLHWLNGVPSTMMFLQQCVLSAVLTKATYY
jgi:hypothetical protein